MTEPPAPETSPLYTASQICKALARPRQSIQRVLDDIPPDGQVQIAGNNGNAWRLKKLQKALEDDLAEAASRCGSRSIHTFLTNPPRHWKPAIPLSQWSAEHRELAQKTMRAC